MPKLLRHLLKLVGVLAIVAWSLVPIGLIALSCFKADRDIFSITGALSFSPTLANYQALWSRWGDFFFGLWNSFLVTVGATVLAVVVIMPDS